jgi:hypothetical protein
MKIIPLILLPVLVQAHAFATDGAPSDSGEAAPIQWVQPDSFDPTRPHLGLPTLEGAKHSILYAPLPSQADPADGGTGEYESLRHGTYNHHQQFLINGDKVIVYWTNHVQDENGPGQRIIAKVGTIADDGHLEWGGDETLVEIAPAPMPAKRRQEDNQGEQFDSAFLDGTFSLSGGKMYLRGRFLACDGWTDDMRFHNSQLRQPVPAEHYRSGRDKASGFRWDIYWFLGRFVQQFDFVDGKLTPTSPVYIVGDPVPESIEVTPGLVKKLVPLNPPYRDARPLAEAPEEIRDFITESKRDQAPWQGYPQYAEGGFKLAANGKNGLAHMTEFERPDGKWVVVRDNLLDSEVYYAALRDDASDTYPPGIRTNLFGTAMPVAGTLPDGSVWIVGSNRDRTDMFITLSLDGILFDSTWSLIHSRSKVAEGVSKPPYGGPQYFQAITSGQSIWIVYSIGKEQIGLTEIPFAALEPQ